MPDEKDHSEGWDKRRPNDQRSDLLRPLPRGLYLPAHNESVESKSALSINEKDVWLPGICKEIRQLDQSGIEADKARGDALKRIVWDMWEKG